MSREADVKQRLEAVRSTLPWTAGVGSRGNPELGPEFSTVESTHGILAELPYTDAAAKVAELMAHAPDDLAWIMARWEQSQHRIKAVEGLHGDDGTGSCHGCRRPLPCDTVLAIRAG